MAGGTISTGALRRSSVLGISIFLVFAILLVRIFVIQTVNFDEYQAKVIDQMTTQSKVAADRGKIYDTNGEPLATNVTTYRVFISPSGIASKQNELSEESDTNYYVLVSKGLAEILGVSYEDVYKQATKYTKYLDRTIKRKVEEDTADLIREYIEDNALESMIHLEAQSTRYYPNGTLGSHILGFTSSDGVGLYGLEYQYDKYLKGVDGYYIKARDSFGNEIPFEYSSYINAISGNNIHTTIDLTVQAILEEQVQAAAKEAGAQNRACGIVMDVKTGAILAMAVSSPFDLNSPWTLSEDLQDELDKSGYAAGTDEYDATVRELLINTWSNKAITESYIPGSTFKIITSAMALEEKKVSLTHSVNCPGYNTVLGIKIKCHETKGHGTLTFAEGVQHSCNVWFMELGERVGIERFQSYVSSFGYKEKTGIDLPGEGNSIFISKMSQLDLAIYAFGQNFNVTPIQQIAAVANGGNLMTPYVVSSVTDSAGNVILRNEPEFKRQVMSEEVCKVISQILEEGVSGDGGAKNAYVAGYRVAAKTGTSEKKTQGSLGMYICSTVAYAPADNPEVAILIMVDEPTKGMLYGSTVAAPYVGAALKNILPHLGVEAVYTEAEKAKEAITVGRYTNLSVSYATSRIEAAGLKVKVVGDGTVVVGQSPAPGTIMEKNSGIIVLKTSKDAVSGAVTVPDLVGLTALAANKTLTNLGLNVKIEGTANYLSGISVFVVAQSIAPGTKVEAGTVVTVTFRYLGADDIDM